MRIDFDRLGVLLTQSGKSKAHLCRIANRSPYYLRDVKKANINIPHDIIEKWADELNTTPDYLTGNTDIKEKPTAGYRNMDYNRFENLRAERGITKKYIADALDRKDTICQDWKKGKSTPNPAQLSIIADILNTTPEYLKGETDIKEKPTAGAVSFEDIKRAVKSMSREELIELAIAIAQEQGER